MERHYMGEGINNPQKGKLVAIIKIGRDQPYDPTTQKTVYQVLDFPCGDASSMTI